MSLFAVQNTGLGIYDASKYFSITDLTVSDTASQKGIPNAPPMHVWPNLTRISQMLDKLYEKIGPFKIISCYRSPALQIALKGITQQAAEKSFHTQGAAVDIQPIDAAGNVTGKADVFFAKLLRSPLASELGEIALKTDTNRTLHISLGLPHTHKTTTPMKVIKGRYFTMSEMEVTRFLMDYPIVGGGILLAILGVGAATFYFTREYVRERRGAA